MSARQLSRALCLCLTSAMLSGCGLSRLNPFAPVEERPAPPVTTAPIPATARPAPALDAPIRSEDTVIYPQPTLREARPAPQPLTSAPSTGAAGQGAGAVPRIRGSGASPAPAAGRPSVDVIPRGDPRVASLPPASGNKVIPEPPTNPAARSLVSKGQSLEARGQLEEAAASYERALEIAPSDPWLWHRLASVRALQGQKGLARALARRSNALGPSNGALKTANQQFLQ